jgi:hypothetical protein
MNPNIFRFTEPYDTMSIMTTIGMLAAFTPLFYFFGAPSHEFWAALQGSCSIAFIFVLMISICPRCFGFAPFDEY